MLVVVRDLQDGTHDLPLGSESSSSTGPDRSLSLMLQGQEKKKEVN